MISKIIDFFRVNKKLTVMAACVISAAASAFCVMYTGLALLQWVTLVPSAVCLFYAIDEGICAKKAYLCGIGFFFAYYFVLFHWFVYMYPLSFLGMNDLESIVVVILAWFGVSAAQAAVSALSLPFVIFVSKGAGKRHRWLIAVLVPALWVLFEWGMSLGALSVPWSRLALGQVDMPAVMQSASLFGSYFVSFLIVLVNFLIGYALFYKRKLCFAVAALLFAVNLSIGGVMIFNQKEGEKISVSAVQGNIPSTVKWDQSLFVSSFRIYINYVEKAAQQGADIVLLPETVVPFVITEDGEVCKLLSDLAKEQKICLVVGAFSSDGEEEYNSLWTFDKDGNINESLYHKRHLVPFGEFMPWADVLGKFIPVLDSLNAFSSDITPGNDSNVIDTEYGRLGGLICFDSIYESLSLDSARDGAQILLLATNDSWFSDSAALDMHNNQARLRAIETGRSVVRAANTGISSIITPTGEVLDSVGAMKRGVLVEDVELRDGVTLYTRIGNLFVYICGGAVLAVALGGAIRRKMKKADL